MNPKQHAHAKSNIATEPERYTPAIRKDLQGNDIAGMSPDKKGGYVTAEDYFNMREQLLGKLAKSGVKARAGMQPFIKDLEDKINELERHLNETKSKRVERDKHSSN